MVCIEKQQIIHAAALLNIKISTAKYILRCFRRHGKVLRKDCASEAETADFDKEVESLRERIEELNRSKKKKRASSKGQNKVAI